MLIDEFLTDGLDKKKGFQYTNYNNRYLIIENIRDLLIASEKEIIIKLQQGEMSVIGDELEIKELGKRIICISGKIKSISSSE